MSFELFRSAIKDSALLDVAAHWDTVRGSRLMPAWSDIDPLGLGRNLPIVWAWRYDAPLGTFVGRLAGEEIMAVLGVNIRGRRIETCFRPEAIEIVRQRYRTLIEGPRLMHSYGTVFARSGGNASGSASFCRLPPTASTRTGSSVQPSIASASDRRSATVLPSITATRSSTSIP